MNLREIKSQLKEDIKSALSIWHDLLKDFHGDNLLYIYSKGSAIKNWDSVIDYVPVISDIDIHYGVHEITKLFSDPNPREASLKISLEYEMRFNKENPNKIHIPRPQVMCINSLQDNVPFVHPLETSVKMLCGEFPKHDKLSDDKIKQIDLDNLADLKSYLNLLPDSYLDKVGLDYWSTLRQLSWRVGPSPVRILTHLLPEPLTIWTWNRSKIEDELRKHNLPYIANLYSEYYIHGWELFQSQFSNATLFQKCLRKGSNLLEQCYNWYLKYATNNRK